MATEKASQTGGGDQRGVVRRMGRERLVRYVTDIIKKQTTPLHDILRDHALPYLPAQSLHRLRAVSTSWNRRISAPFFAHTQSHTHRTLSGIFYPPSFPHERTSYLPFDPRAHAVPDPSLAFLPAFVRAVASSNGLLACRSAADLPRYYVCNPATAEWTALPDPDRRIRGTSAVVLVFQPSALNFNADYYLIYSIAHVPTFEVFSSKTGTWRLSNAAIVDGAGDDYRSPSGVAVAGVAYWRTRSGHVACYDPAADRFRVVEPPPTALPRWRLGEMDGKLCCVGAGEGAVEVHVLEEGRRPVVAVAAVWRKMVAVELGGDPWPLAFEGREERVLVWVEGRVVGIEVRSGTARVVVEGGVPRGCTDGVPYISSLAVVRDLCSGSAHKSPMVDDL